MSLDTPTKESFRSLALTDQIDALHKRAEDLEFKQTLKSLTTLLNERKALLPGIVRHLEGKGVNLPRAKQLGKKKKKSEDKEDEEGGSGNEGGGGNDGGSAPPKVRKTGVQDPDQKNWLPHCYTRLDNCKAPVLEKIATAIEEISFSPYALKSLKEKGTTALQYQAKLLEMIQYDTGAEVSTPLVGDMRHIPTLIDKLKQMRDARGKRGATLKLPPVWGVRRDGVYDLSECLDNFCAVANKGSGVQVSVPMDLALKDCDGVAVPFAELDIYNNFSESKACIGSESSLDTINIASLGGPSVDGGAVKKEDAAGAPAPAEVKTEVPPEPGAGSSKGPQRRSSWMTGSLGESGEAPVGMAQPVS